LGKQVSGKFPQVKDPSLNVRDRLNDALTMDKYSLVGYQYGLNEVIDPQLRQVLLKNRDRLQDAQVRLFTELFNLGEYQATIASPGEVTDAYDVFIGYTSQLPMQQ
jgi:hypothetical protein